MSSFTDLFKRVQVLSEAKVSPVGKQAPVFKDVPKKMKAAGMASSSRDAMIFITQVLSRLDIITPEVYDMTVKGQHKERMEKLMTILKSKEDEINAKSDEIAEYINQNLDNYTAGAGADRGRTEKYKAVAKAMSQEVQNIKAGKEADDALRDIVKTADEDTVETLEFSAEDTTTIIEINTGNVANVEKVKAAVEEFANELGVEVTGNTVEFSVDEGSQIDQMVKKNGVAETEAFFTRAFEGDYPISVSIIPPAGAEEKEKVKAVTDAISSKPEGKIGREHVASVGAAADRFLKKRGLEPTEEPKEDNEGEFDDNDGEEERCDYVPCEDGEAGCVCGECPDCTPKEDNEDAENAYTAMDPRFMDALSPVIDAYEEDPDTYDYETVKGMIEAALDRECTKEECQLIQDEMGFTEDNEDDDIYPDVDSRFMDALSPVIEAHAEDPDAYDYETVKGMIEATLGRECNEDECQIIKDAMIFTDVVVKKASTQVNESKYTTADYITDVYASVEPIVESVVNENGQTTPTQQYLIESAEAAIEEAYTNQYLTEQKASDSLLVPKEEKRESFKERYQPKTSYQLEELRRYGL